MDELIFCLNANGTKFTVYLKKNNSPIRTVISLSTLSQDHQKVFGEGLTDLVFDALNARCEAAILNVLDRIESARMMGQGPDHDIQVVSIHEDYASAPLYISHSGTQVFSDNSGFHKCLPEKQKKLIEEIKQKMDIYNQGYKEGLKIRNVPPKKKSWFPKYSKDKSTTDSSIQSSKVYQKGLEDGKIRFERF